MKKLMLLSLILSAVAWSEDSCIPLTPKQEKEKKEAVERWRKRQEDRQQQELKEAYESGLQEGKKKSRVVKIKPKSNTLSLLLATSPDHLDINTKGSEATVSIKNNLVGGLMYQRLIKEKYSLGGGLLFNNTLFLSGGLEF